MEIDIALKYVVIFKIKKVVYFWLIIIRNRSVKLRRII